MTVCFSFTGMATTWWARWYPLCLPDQLPSRCVPRYLLVVALKWGVILKCLNLSLRNLSSFSDFPMCFCWSREVFWTLVIAKRDVNYLAWRISLGIVFVLLWRSLPLINNSSYFLVLRWLSSSCLLSKRVKMLHVILTSAFSSQHFPGRCMQMLYVYFSDSPFQRDISQVNASRCST